LSDCTRCAQFLGVSVLLFRKDIRDDIASGIKAAAAPRATAAAALANFGSCWAPILMMCALPPWQIHCTMFLLACKHPPAAVLPLLHAWLCAQPRLAKCATAALP
jgi:hypothetical protein